MDSVVISEGQNDLLFLRSLHREYGEHYLFDTFNNQEEEISENKRISQHQVGDSYEYLYKAEGGRPNTSIILSDLAVSLASLNIQTYMIVDLDGSTTSDLYSEVNKYLYRDYGNNAVIREKGRKANSHVYLLDTEIDIDGHQKLELPVISFYEDLEDVTGIVRGDSKQRKLDKINKYISNWSNVCEDIAEFIYE